MKIKLILKIKNCPFELCQGMGIGVVAIEELKLPESIPLQMAFIEEQKQELIKKFIEFKINY